ncbi:osteomodulin [Ornithorhynchus anatinus]|uniref:Osteomodulin n=1 Tax=Ornithorhynchus anatinus TaxID=9258 RepID=F6X302_ORNAN|nr:osteomodulin [Ornithorhynchus anatinus]
MDVLSQLSIIFFLLGTEMQCQYENYELEEDYDQEADAYPPTFHFNPNVDYRAPYFQYPADCARECFCPPALPRSMFCDNRKLKTIPNIPSRTEQLNLQFNEIEAVTTTSFLNATSLKEIDLSHNKIKSHKIDYGVFAKLSNLQQLHLDHNNLEEFPFPLPNGLERLLLGYNEISRVHVHAMDGLINLTMLDLCNNQLHDSLLKGKSFSNMKKLMQINLCNNKLHSMPPDLPSSLMYLSLENNSISFIPKNYFQGLQKLAALRMSHNNLQDIPYDIFNLSNLVELNLGHNKLKQAFYIPRNLEHLYIEDNEIENVNITLLCPSIDPLHYHHLTYIRLEKNRLKAPISTYVFFCFPHMHTIYYGEQKNLAGEAIHLKTQVFRRFQEGEEDDNDHEERSEQEEMEDDEFGPYSY